MRPWLMIMMTALLAGCVSFGGVFEIPLRSDLTREQLLPYKVQGDARVVGQAFLRIEEGGLVTSCAGFDAVMLPAIPIVDEAIKIWKDGREIYATNLEDLGENTPRYSTCDSRGYFIFENLPPLRYWLLAKVEWEFGETKYGGWLAERMDLRQGSQLRVIMSMDEKINSRLDDFGHIKPWEIWGIL